MQVVACNRYALHLECCILPWGRARTSVLRMLRMLCCAVLLTLQIPRLSFGNPAETAIAYELPPHIDIQALTE